MLLAGSAAFAAEKPVEVKIGITAFLSGPALVFGGPARAAAEMFIEEMDADGGIGGVPLNAIFVDEGAGGEHVLSEYRRLVDIWQMVLGIVLLPVILFAPIGLVGMYERLMQWLMPATRPASAAVLDRTS